MIRFTFVFCLFYFPFLWSQEQAIPVRISVFNEATAIPFSKIITTPIHPGIQVGTEFEYKNEQRYRWFQTANVSYFYHNHLMQGVGINTELGYEHHLFENFSVSGLLGLGYMHTFTTKQEYAFTNGHYEKKPDKGNARLYPSISFDLGYSLKKGVNESPQIFIRYQSWAEYPYSPGFIPIMTHINFHVGAKIFITHKRKTNE